jgi:uncharacterized protein YcfJ
MKHRGLIIAGALFAGVTATAVADGEVYYDHAKVIDARPVYTTVRVSTPREECHDVRVSSGRGKRNTYTSVILGGIVGAAIGNELVHGKHNEWGAAAGALLGGSLGNDFYHRYQSPRSGHATERRCRTVESYDRRRELSGYDVTYRYHGREYSTVMDHDPGKRVRVAVSVDVAE